MTRYRQPLLFTAAALFLSTAGMSQAASFDCEAKELKPDEKAICQSAS